jgi:hypothetical protein
MRDNMSEDNKYDNIYDYLVQKKVQRESEGMYGLDNERRQAQRRASSRGGRRSSDLVEAVTKKLGKAGKFAKGGGGVAAGLTALMATGDANAAIDELDFMGKLEGSELPENEMSERDEYNRQVEARKRALEELKQRKYPGITD